MNSKEYLIFDLDDTLLDFKRGEHVGLTKIFKKYAPATIVFEDWLETFKQVNNEVWRQIELGEPAKALLDTRFANTFKTYDVQADGKQLEQEYRGYLDENYHTIEGARELLIRLSKQGFKIIAGTNGKASTQRNRLSGTGFDNLFDDVFISDEIGYAKPHHQFFDSIFSKHEEMTADNTLMIGDSLRSDIQGAINAGITNIWFNPFRIKNETQISPDFKAHTLQEVEKLILQSKLNS